jgi:hypothetical protein
MPTRPRRRRAGRGRQRCPAFVGADHVGAGDPAGWKAEFEDRVVDEVLGLAVPASTPMSRPPAETFPQVRDLHGGAGGTRTHGRRMMSPLEILAALADQGPFVTFLLVRRGVSGRRASVFVDLFLSLRPDLAPERHGHRTFGRQRRLGGGLRTRFQRISFLRLSASGGSHSPTPPMEIMVTARAGHESA